MPENRYDETFAPDGTLISSTPRVVSDADLEREQAGGQVRAALVRLVEIAMQADTVAAQGANVSQAQIKGLFTAVADLARIQRRLILALGRD